MRAIELFEKRRNPEVNTKVHGIDSLRKYEGQDNLFVSFVMDVGMLSHNKGVSAAAKSNEASGVRGDNTSGAKIGINPQSEYQTPNGIYTYPLEYVLRLSGNVPYANDRPYAYVLRSTGRILDLGDYTEDQFDEDVALAAKIANLSDEDITFAKDTAMNQSDAGRMWNVVRIAAEHIAHETGRSVPLAWPGLLRHIGYDGVRDDGYGIIHQNEPHQTVFFTKQAFEIVELVHNNNDRTLEDDFYIENPKALLNGYRAGKVSVEDFIETLEAIANSGNREPMPFKFSELPEPVQKGILDNPLYFYQWIHLIPYNLTKLKDIMLDSPASILRIAHTPRMDKLWPFVRKNLSLFAPYFIKITNFVPDEIMAKAIEKRLVPLATLYMWSMGRMSMVAATEVDSGFYMRAIREMDQTEIPGEVHHAFFSKDLNKVLIGQILDAISILQTKGYSENFLQLLIGLIPPLAVEAIRNKLAGGTIGDNHVQSARLIIGVRYPSHNLST